MPTYFLYARKSTDVEDKQVRSIEDQLAVLRALANQEGFKIAEEFVEKQSAKQPGRPIFNAMLSRLENGEADGVICWKLDRLARNPIDAARVQWLLQQDVIKHIRTNDRSYYPTDNVLMMGFEFGIANQYIRDLSANTKRGLYEKAKRGEYPSRAPIGYLNDVRTKRIVPDPQIAPVIGQAFALYAENGSRLEDVAQFLFERGAVTMSSNRWSQGGGKRLSCNRVKWILTNPIYIGLFKYADEIYQAAHEPIVEKRLFNKVQEVLKARGHAQKAKKEPTPLCRFIRCGECGCFMTSEIIVKRQKNGNIHRYTYYRCTKKRSRCPQPYLREEKLDELLSRHISAFTLPEGWAKEMLGFAERDAKEAKLVAMEAVCQLRDKISELSASIERLTDLYIAGDIERETYLERKTALMSERKSAEEQTAGLGRNASKWLQPLTDWIKDAQTMGKIAETGTLESKKSVLLKIYGSNLVLKNNEIVSVSIPPYNTLLAARKNFFANTEKPFQIKEEFSLVPLYQFVRTYFAKNS